MAYLYPGLYNESFLKKANELNPKLKHRKIKVKRIVSIDNKFKVKNDISVNEAYDKILGKNDELIYDFGNHYVGYISFDVDFVGKPADAPLYLQIKLGEKPVEIVEDSNSYQGDLSSSWIQEETIHIDVIPCKVKLPRRYAFRYLSLHVKDTSPNYKVKIKNVICDSVTAANKKVVEKIDFNDKLLNKIDKVAIKTLEDCMQEFFEDGPKRDRRLWIGDLRLQAQANYLTFKNYDLVKRCLYLFAGARHEDGTVAGCLYTKPQIIVSEISLFDYSLFFISCLYDYFIETNDYDVLKELYPVAKTQIERLSSRLTEENIIIDTDDWWCFLDWNDSLNKEAGANAIFIYALKQLLEIEKYLNIDTSNTKVLIERVTNGVIKKLWNGTFFVSGKEKQISYASQVWFVLAKVFDDNINKQILIDLINQNPNIKMVTPYMYHHFVEALIQCGMYDEAMKEIKNYWGEMVKDGAECFYEVYDPQNKDFSPYKSRVINSYCHAWSCTPTYFLRKYKDKLI